VGRFDLKDYQTVDERLHEFWSRYPEGRVLTELVSAEDGRWVILASVFTDRDDDRPRATGYAEEKIGSSPVNKTSALENGETSAIGRALANLGMSPKGLRPSREEMEKVQDAEKPKPAAAKETTKTEDTTKDWSAMVGALIETHGGDAVKGAFADAGVQRYSELTDVKFAEIRAALEFDGELLPGKVEK